MNGHNLKIKYNLFPYLNVWARGLVPGVNFSRGSGPDGFLEPDILKHFITFFFFP